MTKQLEALKPGKYAILYLDNWAGEGDTYHTIANLEADGRWFDDRSGNGLFVHKGDEILKTWPLDDGYDTLALIAALEQAQQQNARDTQRIAELEAQKTAAFRPDGGDIGRERIKEIADNPYGDEEKCWLARQMLAASPLAVKLPKAAQDVLAERQRQKESKGYTERRDDNYLPGVLNLAGAAYAVSVSAIPDAKRRAQRLWPWPDAGKYLNSSPKEPRAALVKAGALILAEIERMDRAAGGQVEGGR